MARADGAVSGLLIVAGVVAIAVAGVFVWQAAHPRGAIRFGHAWAFEGELRPRPWYVAWTEARAVWGVICWAAIAVVCFVAAFAIPAQEQAREEQRAARAADSASWKTQAEALRAGCAPIEDAIRTHPAVADGRLDDDLAELNAVVEPLGAVVRVREAVAPNAAPTYAIDHIATADDRYLQEHGLDRIELGSLIMGAREGAPARVLVLCAPKQPPRSS